MSDEELLRSANLILVDSNTGKEGITLAAILLFGPDNLIYSVLAHHKTDAIFRMFNVDRYDDRDVILTNLMDSYDCLIAFGEKHLNDLFTMDGIISVSSRDKILREIVSNLLAHRNFSDAYVAKMVIEKDRIFTEIGLADELGSGMRNTYKYTRLYSGAEPQFVQGDVYRTIIPLTEAATATVGPTVPAQDTPQDTHKYLSQNKIERLAKMTEFCSEPWSKKEMMNYMGLTRTSPTAGNKSM